MARHPYIVMCLSVLVTCLAGLGLFWFKEETEMTALWVPKVGWGGVSCCRVWYGILVCITHCVTV